MLVDSHCHLITDLYKNSPEDLIKNANKEGVEIIVTVGNNLEESEKSIELAANNPNVYATAGVYPHEDQNLSLEQIEQKLETLLEIGNVVGVGECGIDIQDRPDERSIEEQLKLLDLHIRLALKHNLPLVIHNRNGDEHIFELLEKYAGKGLTGVFHCFTGSLETAKKIIDMGFYVSFTAIITYPSGKDLLEVAKVLPNDKILIETDAPFLPPQGHRGEINEPKYVKITAKSLADVKNLDFEEISQITYQNSCRLFTRIAPK